MLKNFSAALAVLVALAQPAAAAAPRANPFAAPSTLPFQAPPFDRIRDGDYAPAFAEGIRRQQAEIAAIDADPAPPGFDNTIAALERSGGMLDRVNFVFEGVVQANTDPVLDKVQTEFAPRLAAQQDAIHLDPRLFARVKVLYQRRASLKLTAEQAQLLKLDYQQFVHAGANLDPAKKARLRQINAREAGLEADFGQKLIAATNAGGLVLDDKAALAGLPDEDIANAREEAAKRGLKGKFVIALQNTTQQPLLASLRDRDTRHALFQRRWTATEKGDANDTRADVAELAQLRAERAALLGYPDAASYELYDEMAGTPQTVNRFLDSLTGPAAIKAGKEAALIQDEIARDGQHFALQPWDWDYYADKVRKARYDLDENALKPYFEVNAVLENGVFYAAHKLYGITFKRRRDIPVYQPDVMVYEVFDKDASPLGLIYFDYFQRANKQGGAWMSNFVVQSRLLGARPVIYNVANFTKPVPGQPALISFDDVTTMFHEFGHALHGLFADQVYPGLSGTNVARDFVEFPSQFNEHWALEPGVMAHYARDVRTHAPIPKKLADEIRVSQAWGQGYGLAELLAASALDMQWHSLKPVAPRADVDAFETRALAATHTDFAHVPPRYRSSYFDHIWADGYQAGYYGYQWTIMLDDDAFDWFQRHGGLTRANGQRFRDMILSKGHTEDYAPMFRAFYGRDPDPKPMLKELGLP